MQVKAILAGTRRDLDAMVKQYEADIMELKKRALQQIVAQVVNYSPVDTGTYIMNHEVRLRSGSFRSTVTIPKNALRGRDWSEFEQAAVAKLFADIEAIDLSKDTISIRNKSTHAAVVEHNESVYALARREAGRIIRAEAQAMGFKA